MAKERAPAFQVYAADYLSDENAMAMELDEFGAYWKLELICWREGSIPADLSRLARLLKCPLDQMQRMWPAIEPCFRPGEPGRLVHPRLEKERTKQALNREKRAKAGRASGEARKPNTTEQVSNTCSTDVEHSGNGTGTETNLSVCSLQSALPGSVANATGGGAPADEPPQDLTAARSEAFGLLKATWPGGRLPRSLSRDEFGEPWTPAREGSIYNNLAAADPPADVNAAIRVAIAKNPGQPFTLRTFQSAEPSCQEFYHQCLAEGRRKRGRGLRPLQVVPGAA